MDIKSLIKLLARYKWVLIIVPIVAVTITYFLVQNLPRQYRSEVQISTGLLDPTKKSLSNETVDFFGISQQINGMMEKFKMKKVLNNLSYNLILHDLENPKISFRKYSESLDSLKQADKSIVIDLFKKKLESNAILTLADNNGKYKLYSLVSSMGYGEDVLKKGIDISHADNSDYINIAYESENPNLSAYLVNTLATNFIQNYSKEVSTNRNSSNVMLDSLLKQKEIVMNDKNAALSSFKRNKGVLNLDEQSAAVYGQITTYEAQRSETIRQIQSSQGAIAEINRKLGGSDPNINGSSRADNRDIVRLKGELQRANSAFVENGFRASDQKKIDSITRILQTKSNQNIDENVYDPKASKQALFTQKTNLEISLQQARSSMKSIEDQLASLRAKYSGMVPFDADIQNYQREADLATKEYMTALDQYNQSRGGQVNGLNLHIEQIGLPGNPEPSKRIIYLAGSGFGSFAICLGFVLVIFFLDDKIVTSQQLASATKSKTIGMLNQIEGDERRIREIWSDTTGNGNYELYRDMLRSLRFEINGALDVDDSKILGITSLGNEVGKTFTAYSLAYAFAMTGKKVLLIADELPVVKSESKGLVKSLNFQTFLIKKEIHTEDLITVMNKSTARESLLEVQSIKSLKAGFDILKNEFDIILVDVNNLRDMNLAKEWLLFTEKNIAIFEYGATISETDREYVDYIKKTPGFLGWVLNKIQLQN
ncbi:lipopolysaccharide biosynthesis protein [Pedobacter sp. Leaf194]|uniref:exopolysaccharide transport family protein n=1 Tax=Pedobacter sp. Leaf194 TaxID=1736297 RepID=UPI0007035451|nr:lipopolysaccharide biosynthesis protein [Pedobacter sp. Leaf194]KQS32296.1 lipopolysaccharide biosynthesis protein [Pedobacter sp. Leaf194]